MINGRQRESTYKDFFSTYSFHKPFLNWTSCGKYFFSSYWDSWCNFTCRSIIYFIFFKIMPINVPCKSCNKLDKSDCPWTSIAMAVFIKIKQKQCYTTNFVSFRCVDNVTIHVQKCEAYTHSFMLLHGHHSWFAKMRNVKSLSDIPLLPVIWINLFVSEFIQGESALNSIL